MSADFGISGFGVDLGESPSSGGSSPPGSPPSGSPPGGGGMSWFFPAGFPPRHEDICAFGRGVLPRWVATGLGIGVDDPISTLLDVGKSPGAGTSHDTGVVTVKPERLYLLEVMVESGTGAAVPTTSFSGMTWDLVTSSLMPGSVYRLVTFRGMPTSQATSKTTLTFGNSSSVVWAIREWQNVNTLGDNGSGAVAGVATANSASATSLTVVGGSAFGVRAVSASIGRNGTAATTFSLPFVQDSAFTGTGFGLWTAKDGEPVQTSWTATWSGATGAVGIYVGIVGKLGDRAQEEIEAQCEVVTLALGMEEAWLRQTYRLTAEGRWLDELGAERGVFRRVNESDASYRIRVGTVADAVTPVAVLAAINDTITAAGGPLSPPVEFVECMCDCAYMGDNSVLGAASIQSYIGDGSTSSGNTNGDPMAVQTGCPHSFVVLLPAATSDPLFNAINDLVRLRKAFGILHYVERLI